MIHFLTQILVLVSEMNFIMSFNQRRKIQPWKIETEYSSVHGEQKESTKFKHNAKAKVFRELQKKIMQHSTCEVKHLDQDLFKLLGLDERGLKK